MKDDKSKSNLCKSDCVDLELVFCAGNNYQEGKCCDPITEPVCPKGRTDFDPRFKQTQNWCSNRNPDAPK